MTKQAVILIYDAGKTNKKRLLYDHRHRLVFEDSVRLPETADEDGFPCEDIHALTAWIKNSFQQIMSDERFAVKAVNFSAYGASFVYVDENLLPVLPLYNYLKPYPEPLKEKFYKLYGGEAGFSKIASSPVLGSLNSGMQLYRLKNENPNMFSKIRYALHLPQYLSSILTGKAFSEITSLGCHTNLWDFTKQGYHDWVRNEGAEEKFPPMMAGDECVKIRHKEQTVCVGVGLHDSSSALIPYLEKFHEPFVLLSTGTWCISLNAFNKTPLSSHELRNDCLCFLTYRGHPLKASRLFAGFEHEQKAGQLAEYYKTEARQLLMTKYNSDIADKIKSGSIRKEGRREETLSSPNDLGAFDSCEEAYHRLMMDIVEKQAQSSQLVLEQSVNKMFIDGGFSQNDIYMNLMAEAFPDLEVYSATVPQSSALGAALAIRKHWNKEPLPTELIRLKFYPRAARTATS